VYPNIEWRHRLRNIKLSITVDEEEKYGGEVFQVAD
jgi:hypothetical protein